jgi:hypothetical protein
MELKANQAALILELSDEGEMTVHLESPVKGGLPEDYCRRIAEKLLYDENFRTSLHKSELDDLVN